MNIYKVIFKHHAVKDARVGMAALLLAKDVEQVYEWIALQPALNEGHLFNDWMNNRFASESKANIIRLKGDINDPDIYDSHAYFGMVLYGWELVQEDVEFDETLAMLLVAGILFRAK